MDKSTDILARNVIFQIVVSGHVLYSTIFDRALPVALKEMYLCQIYWKS